MVDIVHHHPVGIEPPAEGPDRAFHAGNPFFGQSIVFVAIKKERDYFIEQNAG